MSLPAGASITSIAGKRCTAIPRAATTVNASSNSSAFSSAVVVVASTPPAALITSILSTDQAVLASSTTSNLPVAPTTPDTTTSQSQSTSAPVALPASTQSTSSTESPSTSSPDTIPPAAPVTASAAAQLAVASETPLSTPATTQSPKVSSKHASSTPRALVQTDSSARKSPTGPSVYSNQVIVSNQIVATASASISPTQAGEDPAQSSAVGAVSTSSNSKVKVGSVMGGVVGGVALIGLFLLLWWRCIKRRRSRNSLLTPLTGSFDRRGEKYEIDGDSLGPTPLGKKWKAQAGGFCWKMQMNAVDLGSALKAKLGQGSDAPSIDMNRGNSQFLEPIQQHSRSSSAVAGGHETPLTTRDRFADWWQRAMEDVNFNWRLRQKSNDPTANLTAARAINEKEAQLSQVSPNFSQFLVMKDHELRRATERHRRSQSTATLPQLGSLGLEFSGTADPFADPFPNVQPTIPNISKPPGALTSNPFADPVSKSNGSDYVSSVRRSRGLSQPLPRNSGPTTRLPSNTATRATSTWRQPSIAAPSSRYPSTIRSSRDTYRDTVLSALSISGRTAKGRSDPFDLDRPDLLKGPPPIPSQNQVENSTGSQAVTTQPRIVSNVETYLSSNYSSGVSTTLDEWGDPGPDLGPAAWRRPGAVDDTIRSYDVTRGSVSSGQGSHIITVGRAL